MICNSPFTVYACLLTVSTPVSKFRSSHWVCAVRLVLIPLMSIALLSLFSGVSVSLRYALLIAACAPIGANVAVYAQRLNGNYTYAVQLVCLSTLLSIITMPLIMGLAGVLWA